MILSTRSPSITEAALLIVFALLVGAMGGVMLYAATPPFANPNEQWLTQAESEPGYAERQDAVRPCDAALARTVIRLALEYGPGTLPRPLTRPAYQTAPRDLREVADWLDKQQAAEALIKEAAVLCGMAP